MDDHAPLRHVKAAGGSGRVTAAVVHPPTEALDAAAEETGRRLFAQACDFVAGVTTEAAMPPAGLPEIAFAGRSNVGKSSLVNALTGRTTLARVSHTPGRTQQLNFFALGQRLMLVDLPGYGYARAAKADVARWTELTRRYLKGRANLRRVLLLIDARHGIKDVDRAVMTILEETAVSFQLVLTKVDKVAAAELQRRLAAMAAEAKRHVAAHPVLHLTSAHEGSGIAALRAALAPLAAAETAG
jgi:GTP-binding protein